MHPTLRASAVDPFRRVAVPRDLTPLIGRSDREVDPESVGMTADGVERIWASVRTLFRRGIHPAVTVCVRRQGQVVLDRSVGWARGAGPGAPRDAEPILVTPDTPFCVFSTSKAITATLIHVLAERGALHLGDRVADHLPEFAGSGRDAITIEHVLSHRAGIPQIPHELMNLDRLADPDRLLEAIPLLRSQHRPGAAVAYHAISGGFVLAEVVRRAIGADIRTVLAKEILDPLEFRWTNYGVDEADLRHVGLAHPTGLRPVPPLSTLMTRALGVPVDELTRMSNDPRLLTGIVPSGNVVSTAYELSRFMELLCAGGTLDGVTVMSPRTIRRALAETAYHEFDRTLGVPIRYSSGFMLGARAISPFGPHTDEAFGHMGFTNISAWADPRRELAVGLITSGKAVVGPHLDALWRFTRRVGVEAPRVAEPRLYRS